MRPGRPRPGCLVVGADQAGHVAPSCRLAISVQVETNSAASYAAPRSISPHPDVRMGQIPSRRRDKAHPPRRMRAPILKSEAVRPAGRFAQADASRCLAAPRRTRHLIDRATRGR